MLHCTVASTKTGLFRLFLREIFTQNAQSFFSTTLRYLDPNHDGRPHLANVFIAGALSGVAVCSLSPVELVKIRLQMITSAKPGKLSMVTREIYRQGGLFGKNGLYRGFTAQVARDAWGYRFFFEFYL